MAIWFTSDQHFGHENIIKYCSRPFASIEEMDEYLIANWNSTVDEDDVVWHLGDLSYKASGEYVRSIIARLNGFIHMLCLPWHHDKQWMSEVGDIDNLRFEKPLVAYPFSGTPVITMSHYPLASWEASFHGAWHLHGHSHGMYSAKGKILDVGVDNHNYFPISLERVKELMKTR